jgi:hypothetical protein
MGATAPRSLPEAVRVARPKEQSKGSNAQQGTPVSAGIAFMSVICSQPDVMYNGSVKFQRNKRRSSSPPMPQLRKSRPSEVIRADTLSTGDAGAWFENRPCWTRDWLNNCPRKIVLW